MFGTHESLLDHADASSDLEYALFRDELEQQRTADEAKQSKNLFSLRSVIIFFAIVCGAASVCAAGTYLLSSNTDMNIPLAVYDFAEDSFSMGSYPHLETLLEKKASKGTKHTMTPEQKKKVLDKVKTEVEPCDDFYAHACGMWEDNFDLNGEMSHVDSFDTIMARTVQQQYQTLDDVFPFITPFYNTCMAAVDPVDTNLMKLFTSIDQGVADADTFFHMLGQLNRGNLAADAIFQHELLALSGDEVPGGVLDERVHLALIGPIISKLEMCSDLVDLVELLNIVPEGKTANDVAANLAKVAEFVINTYEASGADDDMATCSGSALTKSGVTENWQRMFVSYGEGLGDGTLYQQAKTSDFFDAEHCIWGGSEDTVTKLADFFYAQSTESQVQSMRDFLKLSVVVNKLDLLPKKYADAWNSDEKDEDEGDEDEGDEDVFAILKELEGQDIDKSVHYAPFDGPEGYPDVQLNAEETEMLRRFMIAAQGNYIVAGIIDQEAMTHLKTTSLKSLLSAKSGSLGAASANVRPAVLALRWMTLSKTEMRREWMNLPKEVRSVLWQRMSHAQRVVCKDAEFKHKAQQRREKYNPHPVVDDSMLKKRFNELYDLEALKQAGDAERQSKCMKLTIATFNNLFAHDWVLDTFPKENLEVAQELVDMIYNQMAKHIKKADWLDSVTITKALEKWSKMAKNVAFDSDWQDAPNIKLSGDMFMDIAIVFAEQKGRGYALLDQPVDRFKFPFAPGQMDMGMDYFTPNAFYFPIHNSINMLAGLMAEPLFSADMPMQLNLASYGYIIGHEITHGFDNNGRQYDGEGRKNDWWSEEATESFQEHAMCLVDQFDSYRYYGLFHVNGEQTLGENIADLGGLSVAWDTFQEYEQKYNTQGDRLMEEYTNSELFWVYAGQSWCGKSNLLGGLLQLVSDPHSPGKARVNAPMSNLKGFAETFQCKSSSVMGRSLTEEACDLW